MIISYKWLSDYLPEALPVEQLSQILTSIGLEVEAVEPVETVKGSLEGLMIGEVLTAEKHPNADKLRVTTVNIGNGVPLKIVCGAPNVAPGQRVVVATVGTTVHPTQGESFLIKKAKIRGEESEGMICAEDEIGLGTDHGGIIVLPADAPIGMLAKTYFKIPDADQAIHIGLTPNRSDAMSHIGVARDVCAYLTHLNSTRYSVKMPHVTLSAKHGNVDVNITIKDETACPRYTGISLSNVKVGPSPEWLQQRLNAIDVRPINNVVDITNYVLHEFGQPLHAFDADKIKGNKIVVGFQPEGSSFITLDGKERKLRATDLVIGNESEGMCIAGVFGGLDSGVTEQTKNIFLESAYFNPSYIRRTSLHHGLRTDAATHFEKGVDINNVVPALERAATLMVEICGAHIASDVIDVYAQKIEQVHVDVSYDYINKLSGKEYPAEKVKQVLKALGFEIEREDAAGMIVKVPSNKTDVSQPADIVEEILRIDGLDNIRIPERLNISLSRAMPNDRAEQDKLATLLSNNGFHEIVTNSIVNSKYYPERMDLVRMLNSLTSELDVMRPSLLESGLEVIQYNYNRKSQDLCLYEFGKVYTQQSQGKYDEEMQLGMWLTGNVQAPGWQTKAAKADIFYVKGILQKLLMESGISKAVVQYEPSGSKVSWKWKNEVICTATEVPSKKLQDFDIKQPVFFVQLHWLKWLKAAAANKIKYSEVPKYPVVQRDLAIILDTAVSYQQVEEVTAQLKIDSLRRFELFDVFESEKLGANKKSYALSYTFQLLDRTLTDTEIEQLMQQLMNAYKSKLQAQIRE